MTSSVPNLLTLPRELRDHIYSYLSHETQTSVPCYNAALTGFWFDRFTIYAHNAPLPNVLQVHSLLRDEYLKAPCSTALSLTVNIDRSDAPGPDAPNPNIKEPAVARSLKFAQTLLRKAKHICFVIDCGNVETCNFRHDTDHLAEHWLFLKQYLNSLLSARSTRFLSIKVAYRFVPHERVPADLLDAYLAISIEPAPHPPSRILAGLPLVQRVQGHRFTHVRYIEQLYDWPDVEGYLVTRLGCYLFQGGGGDGNGAKCWWDKRQVLELWPDSEYKGPHVARYENDKVFEQDGRPHLFGGWRERRGGEGVQAWDED